MTDSLSLYGPGIIAVLFTIAAIAIVYLIFDSIRRKKMISARVGDIVMLEVRVPRESGKKEDEPLKSYRDYVAVAEQLISSFSSFYENKLSMYWYGQPVFSLEIVSKNKEIIFFVGTPKSHQSTIEKQILSFYPSSQVEPSNDFKIFDANMKASIGVLDLNKQFIYPLRTYQELEADPLANVTNSLLKLGDNVRASIQILVRPQSEMWRSAVGRATEQLQSGQSVSASRNPLVRAVHGIGSAPKTVSQSINPEVNQQTPPTQPSSMSPIKETQMQLIQKKGEKTGFDTQIRIVAVAPTAEIAKESVRNIYSSFAQFNSPDRNGLKIIFPRAIQKILPYYILRHFSRKHIMLLNSEEIASIFHFPSFLVDTPGIRWFSAKRAPAPNNIPSDGLVLGENLYRGDKTLIRIKEDDRRRHLYAIGMTGTGKSTFFESMILQDIRAGRGVGFFDPHGDAIEDILSRIPKERMEDVILFDPSDRMRPFGLNLLEWKTPEQKDFLVQEAVQIFYKLFDPQGQGFIGPQFEHWMRNAALTLMESEGGGTLIEIPRLFIDEAFRSRKIAEVKDPVVKAFWEKQLASTADFHKSEMYNYFISKFGRFMTNDMMRNIMGQAKSSFDLRDIMDQKKILLVNLSKGQIGEVNSSLLGMILVARLFTAALSRQSSGQEKRNDFYLYVDEFQNFATDTFSSILSEARKYNLNLSITNQYIAQLPEAIRDAIVGNVGTLVSFRVGVPDAEFMAHEFAPVFNDKDLNNIEAFNCYIKLLIDNTPTAPFSMRTIKDAEAKNENMKASIKSLSALKYGRDRAVVEAEVRERTRNETNTLGNEGSPPPPEAQIK